MLVNINLPVLFFHRSAGGGLSIFFLNFMLGCVYVHMYMCCEVYVTTFMQMSEDNLGESIFSIYHMDQTQVLRFGEHLYLPSHLSGPGVVSKRFSLYPGLPKFFFYISLQKLYDYVLFVQINKPGLGCLSGRALP